VQISNEPPEFEQMTANENGSNDLIPRPHPAGEVSESSRRNDWLTIQSANMTRPHNSTIDPANDPTSPQGNITGKPPKSPVGNSGEWGFIIAALGIVVLIIIAALSHDTSYRNKMTPQQRYYDDLRNEQDAAEDGSYR
jgi:hypothetical protein